MNEVDALRQELARIQKRLNEMEKAADRDPLLPLLNRRAFVRDLTQRIGDAPSVPASLIYFDLNHLKEINDTYGHIAGDAVLLHFAEVVLAHVGAADHVGRLGGDEFGVLLARATKDQAVEKAESLAATLRASPLSWSGLTIAVSFSYGAFEVKPGDNAEMSLARADEEMYAQKRARRRAAE